MPDPHHHDDTELQQYCLQWANEKPANRNFRGKLLQDLTEATLEAESASMEFEAVMTDTPSRIPHPDGTQRIHNAAQNEGRSSWTSDGT